MGIHIPRLALAGNSCGAALRAGKSTPPRTARLARKEVGGSRPRCRHRHLARRERWQVGSPRTHQYTSTPCATLAARAGHSAQRKQHRGKSMHRALQASRTAAARNHTVEPDAPRAVRRASREVGGAKLHSGKLTHRSPRAARAARSAGRKYSWRSTPPAPRSARTDYSVVRCFTVGSRCLVWRGRARREVVGAKPYCVKSNISQCHVVVLASAGHVGELACARLSQCEG